MATSTLRNVIIKAYQLFKTRPTSSEQLTPLTESMNTLNAENVNLHEIMNGIPSKIRQQDAPVTFIEVCNNPIMTAVIIVIKPGQGIPLHDHPGMIGLIKVLHGQVLIQSYTPIEGSSNGNLTAVRIPDTVLSRFSPPQVLFQTSQNIHQIQYVSGESGKEEYAAFLDILSPPYQDKIGCHYYKSDEPHKVSTDAKNRSTCNLVEVDCPSDYRTTSILL